ncbi:hypothetical protein RFI_08360 [Reticulomyxa filosa]|uniref:Glycosyl transferase family 1 domain-containing protein n=1 Tax=Reticulomyxa filosa TaxID=46433 RepID=X6NRX4_RETFI|nr:hypothetical protein RFI_08360 [Reticulomyxa filosa]|eukprot:ETO28766.1 hypothetical protein RFI_08360 [Reticulomyxa filosa]
MARNKDAIWQEVLREMDKILPSLVDNQQNKQLFLSRIHVLSQQYTMNEMASLYACMDAYVQASHGEGFGLPVLESMAIGVPVIVTNWSGLTDLVTEHGQFGLLINITGLEKAKNTPGKADFDESFDKWASIDVKSLQKNMRWIVENNDNGKAKAMGLRGKDFVWKHFHPHNISAKIVQRMKEMIFMRDMVQSFQLN